MGKLDSKVFSVAIFTITALFLAGSSQYASAGEGFTYHVWSDGGANDNWDNPDNWFEGNVPNVQHDPSFSGTIYIGCDFAPTPDEGPAPTNVNAILNIDEQTIISPDNDGLMLCEGSTLNIEEDSSLEIIPEIPESPIYVSHTNFGTIINNGFFAVFNPFANDDYIEVHLHNEGTITNTDTGSIYVENNGANNYDVEVLVTNDLDTSIITNDGAFLIANNGAVSGDYFDITVELENYGTVTNNGEFTVFNSAAMDSTDEIYLTVNVDNEGVINVNDGDFSVVNNGELDSEYEAYLDVEFNDNDGDLEIGEDASVTLANTARVAGLDYADIDVEFDDNDEFILNGGTLNILNSGIAEGCEADIDVGFDDNDGIINNGGIILLENTADGISECDSTSYILVELENDGSSIPSEDQGIINNDGTITLFNSGDADEIEVRLENQDTAILTNTGDIIIENTGEADDLLEVELENEDSDSVINNECGGEILIKDNDLGSPTRFVGVLNDGTINNFLTATITVDDDGDISVNDDIDVESNSINFLPFCSGDPLAEVYVVMGVFGNEDPENGSLATANLETGELLQVGPAIAPLVMHSPSEGFYDGLSGLAINSQGEFYVTAVVQEDFPSQLLQIDPNTGAIITDVGPNQQEVGEDTRDAKMRDLAFQPGTDILFGVGNVEEGVGNALFTIDTSDATVELVSVFEGAGTIRGLAFDPTDGTLYGVNCSLWSFDTTPAPSGFMPDLVTELDTCYDGLGINDDGQIFGTSQGDSLHLIDPSDGSDITVAGQGTNPSDVDFGGQAPAATAQDQGPYPRPHLGDQRYGGGHNDGFCMDQNCMNVRSNYYNHFPETTVAQGSTHTFTLLVNCQRGAATCIHASIGGALPDSTFYDTRWDASLDKNIMTGEWTLTTKNDHGEIGTVTGTVQEVGETFIQVSFNVQFLIPSSVGTTEGEAEPHENNRHLHVTVYDNQRGMSNYIFNDGMLVEDIYAYPVADMSFDPALEYEQLCLNEDSTKRHTCAFDKVRDWTIKNAEDTLKEMYNQKGTEMDSFDESEQN